MLIYYIMLYSTILYGIFESWPNHMVVERNTCNIYVKNRRITWLRRIIIFMLSVQFVFLAAFRDISVGSDLLGYMHHFISATSVNFNDILEKHEYNLGYYILNWIIGKFTDDFQIFMSVIGAITIFLYLYSFYKESKIIWLSVFIFLGLGYLDYTFCLLKQSLSMAIVAYSYRYIKKENLLKFLICILIAGSFHMSAICCIPMYYVARYRLNLLNGLKYILLSIGVIISTSKLLGNFVVTILLAQYYEGRYSATSNGGYNYFLFLFVILCICLVFRNSTILNDKKNLILYNIIILSVVLQLISLNISIFFRIVQYYTFFLTILIPNIVYSIRGKNIKMAVIFGILLLFSVSFSKILFANVYGIVPYTFLSDY